MKRNTSEPSTSSTPKLPAPGDGTKSEESTTKRSAEKFAMEPAGAVAIVHEYGIVGLNPAGLPATRIVKGSSEEALAMIRPETSIKSQLTPAVPVRLVISQR